MQIIYFVYILVQAFFKSSHNDNVFNTQIIQIIHSEVLDMKYNQSK